MDEKYEKRNRMDFMRSSNLLSSNDRRKPRDAPPSDEEEDPLDAFMRDIEGQVAEQKIEINRIGNAQVSFVKGETLGDMTLEKDGEEDAHDFYLNKALKK